MKKRFFALLMALLMAATLIGGALPAMAAGEITLRLHYNRPDGDYDGWDVWFWDLDSLTMMDPPYQFETVDGEQVATVQVNPETASVGYIVRYGDWEEKDVDRDQFIDITGVLSGTVDVYVESGIEGHEIVLGEDVVLGTIVTHTKYVPQNRKGYPEIQLTLSSKLDYEPTADTFQIIGPDGNVVPLAKPDAVLAEGYMVSGQFAYLYPAEPLDLSKSYFVKFESLLAPITMPDYFSTTYFEQDYTYTGDDLGQTYTKDSTTLRVWAPTADAVSVRLYENGDVKAQSTPDSEIPMTKDVRGTWVVTLDGDLNGTYYTYCASFGTEQNEATDPYARAVGINGDRSMIIDLDATDPTGWESDENPHAGESITDSIIWELHIRDLSSDSSAGIANTGKFLGLIEGGTTTPGGTATGLDHMVDLGITHVQLMPVYDFGSVDETKKNEYSWGYDPENYNVPEGSYSTDPYHGEVRVREFKQMVQGLHDAGISVIMDVVYNHVADSSKFCFNQLVPNYFTRPNSNGSGCGNDNATERSMVHKYIVDSLVYWANEYHIDGFRFDLAGLIDIDTINAAMAAVHETRPDVLFYGEGWSAGTTAVTKDALELTFMDNAGKVPGFAFFSDTIRIEVKGNTYAGVAPGFICGGSYNASTLLQCFKGLADWCPSPTQTINYLSCHDNNTLFDHITQTTVGASEEDRIAMNRLGAAFYLTAQGVPFLQAGEEFLRSKPCGDHSYLCTGGLCGNSYDAGDAVNSLKWSNLEWREYQETYNYYKGLIAFRKAHPALRMTTAAQINGNILPLTGMGGNVQGYFIRGGSNGETASAILAYFNPSSHETRIPLPEGNWDVYINDQFAGTEVLETVSGQVYMDGISALVLVKNDTPTIPDDPTDPSTPDDPTNPSGETTSPDITEPSTEVIEPSTEVTEPIDDPTAPSEGSGEPTDAPIDPDVESTEPSAESSKPTEESSEPAEESSEPTGESSEEPSKSTRPTKDISDEEEDEDDSASEGVPMTVFIIAIAAVVLVMGGGAAAAIIIVAKKKT